jgi:hypothetical protein
LTKKERLTRQALGQEIDRAPALGGWMEGVRNLAGIAGISPADTLAEVEYFLDATQGGKGMFLITRNVSGVEAPPEILCLAYRAVKEKDPGTVRPPDWRAWPWLVNHPESR